MMKWLPSSKMTAVGVTGAVYTWGVWVLDHYYDVGLEPLVIAGTQACVSFIIGYAITEHRWIS